MRIAHLSDIHIRLKDRHEEYTEVFSRLYESLKEKKPDRILVAGDIVHSKITLSPELVAMSVDFFRSLAGIAPVDVIVGNHDMNMSNMDRLDSLTPIIDASQDPSYEINYYTGTGLHQFADGFVYGVHSLLDNGEPVLTKKTKVKGTVYIALYHGCVAGSTMDSSGYVFSDSARLLNTFDQYDFVMLGDIHKRQFLNDKKTAAYCGSLIQQNHSEDIEKGYLLWDINGPKDFTCDFIQVPNDYAFATINADDGTLPDVKFPPKTRIRVIWPMRANDISKAEVARLNGLIKSKYDPLSIQLVFKPIGSDGKTIEVSKTSNLSDPEVQRDLLIQWFDTMGEGENIEELIKIDEHVNETVMANGFERITNSNWHLKTVSMENFMSYGPELTIDFNTMRGVVGLFGENTAGKSVIIDAILYALFNKTTRDVKNEDLVNKDTGNDVCRVKLQIEIAGVDYELDRWTTRQYQKKTGAYTSSRTDVTLKRRYNEDIGWENLTETQRTETEKVIRNAIGSFDDFMLTTLSTQGGATEFLKLKKAPRADIMLRFLGLEVFAKKYDYAKDLLKGVEATIKSSRTDDIEQLETRRTELEKVETEIKTTNKRIESFDEELEKLRGDIETHTRMINNTIKIDKDASALRRELDEILDLMEAVRTEREEIVESISTLTNELKGIESSRSLSEEKILELSATRKTADKIKDDIRTIKAKIESSKRVLKVYKSDLDSAPECPVSDDSRHATCSFLAGYTKKKGECKTVLNEVSTFQSKLDALTADLAAIDNVYAILEEQEEVQAILQRGAVRLADMNRKLVSYDNKLEVKEVSTNLVKSQLVIAETNEDTIKKNREHKIAIADLNGEVSKLNSSKSSLISALSQLDRKAGVLTKEISTIEDMVEKLRACDERRTLLGVYCAAMHRTGLQVDILRNHIPTINYEINKLLGDVVKFQVYLKIDEDGTDIDILMQYGENEPRPASMASGMEKLLINMAIRYALLSVSNLNTSSSWFIDEGFGVLDAENISSMAQFFDNVRGVFRNIVIITHLDTLKDVADWTINIHREGGISVASSPVKSI